MTMPVTAPETSWLAPAPALEDPLVIGARHLPIGDPHRFGDPNRAKWPCCLDERGIGKCLPMASVSSEKLIGRRLSTGGSNDYRGRPHGRCCATSPLLGRSALTQTALLAPVLEPRRAARGTSAARGT